jgi:hypothetical protein
LANLHVVSGSLAGQTVAQVLALANSVLGGAAPPAGITISDLNNVVDSINGNFDGGTTNNGYLQSRRTVAIELTGGPEFRSAGSFWAVFQLVQ